MEKYNFVFYNAKDSYHEPLFAPLRKFENVIVNENAFSGNNWMKKLCFFHWSAKINSYFKVPLKTIWFKKMCDLHFTNNKPICYVFYNGKYISQDLRLFNYIKRKNPNNKIVVIYDDLIGKMYSEKQEKLFQKADLVCSYDKLECEKYQIALLEGIYYAPLLPVTMPTQFEYDVYFLGYAKDRLDMIHSIWKRLTQNGVKCKFLIAGVETEKRLPSFQRNNSQESLLEYIDKPISYRESLTHIQNCRCILEIVQGNSVATTLRANEAVCYKRKLITNALAIKESQFFSEKNMCRYECVEQIDINFCKSGIDYDDYEEKHTLSAKDYLSKIEQLLAESERKYETR